MVCTLLSTVALYFHSLDDCFAALCPSCTCNLIFFRMRGSITELIVTCVMLQYRQGSQGDFTSAGDSWYWRWSNWFFPWPGNLRALPSCCWTSVGRCMYWINVIFLLYDKESYEIVYEIEMAGWYGRSFGPKISWSYWLRLFLSLQLHILTFFDNIML